MKSILLFTFTLLLTACSDTTSNNQTTTSSAVNQTSPVKTAPVEAAVATAEVAPPKAETPINGHSIFVHKCASCHGSSGEKAALNKSKIIAGWHKEKIYNALKGYQDSSYGGKMKAIMKGQVSALDDKQIEAIAAYIATL